MLFKKEKKSKIIIKSSPRGTDADFPKIESSDLTQSMKQKLSSIYISFLAERHTDWANSPPQS